jgi:HD-GYP domain-containing protein (c-di-GMP phosphodiesterase class II)
MNLSRSEQNNLIIAAALHDLGAFSLQERLDALNFEVSFDLDNFCEHAEVGYLLLQKYEPFSEVAELIRYHHLYWVNKDLARFENGKLDLKSHFIHLADRIDVLIDKDEEILGQVKKIVAKIEEEAGIMFSPQLVEIFKNLAKNGDFWFELTSPSIKDILLARYTLDESGLDLDGLLILAQFFAQIVDIRSRFTATHSWGVAVVAAELGRFMGLSPKEVKMLKIAGYLHDLGKLAIPQEILNSSNSLTEDQYRLMKNHALYTYNALKEIKGLEIITDWASFHHERLDGKGYPFSYSAKDLNLGARIVAVADLFTATAEDRPYRKGMAKEEVLGIIEGLVEDGLLTAGLCQC